MRRPSTLLWKKKDPHDRTGATRCAPSKRNKATAIHHWKRRNRIRNVNGIQIILEKGWMIKCGKDKNDLRWMSQKTRKNILWCGGMFMSVTLESAVLMGKNYLDNCHSITNTRDLWLKQMFDISARFVSEQVEISGVETIGWENHSWKYLFLVGDERVINLQRTKVYVFSQEPPIERCMGRQSGDGSNHLRNTETLTELTASQWNSNGIFSQDSLRCSSVKKSNIYCSD